MRRPTPFAVAAVVLAITAACAPVSQYKPKGELVPYQGFHARLPSGMQVIVYEVPQVDRFSLTLSYGSGSSEDPAGKEGLAHLVEHLLFRTAPAGSNGAPIWDQLTANGWRFNATTDWDSTDYFEVGKPSELGDALKLEASRMREPLAGLDEKAFLTERDVVLSEYRERFETNRTGAQVAWLLEGAFPSHPYGRPVGGTPETLRAITLADTAAWVKERYQPRNAVLVVTSPYKSREVMRRVLEGFGELAEPPGPDQAPRVATAAPLPPRPGEVAPMMVKKAPVRQPTVWVGWAVPGLAARKDPQGQAAANAIAKAFSTLIYTSFGSAALSRVEGFGVFYAPIGAQGMIVLTANLADAGDAERVVELARSAAVELILDDQGDLNDPLTERARKLTVIETRDQLLVDAYLELEHLDGAGVAAYLRATGEPDYLAGRRRNVSATLNSDISTYAAENLKRERSVSLLVLPDANGLAAGLVGAAAGGGSSVLVTPDRNDLEDGRWAPPGPDRVREVARAPGLATTARKVLPNGLEVLLARRGSLPVAEVHLLLRTSVAGTPALPAGAPAFALATNVARFAAVGAVRVGAASQVAIGRETVERATWGSAANLEVLLESTAQWARDQKVRYHDEIEDAYLRVVRRWEREPETVASAALMQGLFPAHPYAAVPSADALKQAGTKPLSRFLDDEFRPERAALVVVSNQPETPELWAAIERHFGGWTRGSSARAEPPPVPPQRRRVVLVDRRGASQAVIAVGLRAPPWPARDRAAADAAVWLAENRLMQRLRIAEGVTYGAHVGLLDQRGAGALLVSTAVAREAAARSLGTTLATLETLARAEVTPNEAGRARWQVARGYATAFDTVGGSAAALVEAAQFGAEPAEVDAQAERIATLDAARIQKAMAALPVGQESIVVLGDAETLRPQLEAAGFSPELVRP
ncbi:MAG: insulinase family protein [Anaeromyxobacter sp.]